MRVLNQNLLRFRVEYVRNAGENLITRKRYKICNGRNKSSPTTPNINLNEVLDDKWTSLKNDHNIFMNCFISFSSKNTLPFSYFKQYPMMTFML